MVLVILRLPGFDSQVTHTAKMILLVCHSGIKRSTFAAFKGYIIEP